MTAEERVNAAAIEDQAAVEVPQRSVEADQMAPEVPQRPAQADQMAADIADQVAEAIAQAIQSGPVRATGLGDQRLPLTQLGLHQHADLEIERKTGLGHVVDPQTFREDH